LLHCDITISQCNNAVRRTQLMVRAQPVRSRVCHVFRGHATSRQGPQAV
jgi:hypothetical protein